MLAMKKFTFFLFIIAVSITAYPQKKNHNIIKALPPVCYASDEIEDVYVPPPFLKAAEKKSDIRVTYSLFPENAKKAFEYAVAVWEQFVESPIPIYLQANWRSLDRNVLGSCGPADYRTNFEDIPHKNVYYPISVVEKITRRQITGISQPDITGEFNKNINWYFGTDGNTPDSLYDFVSVAMHEIGHGLGFTGFFFVNELLGTYGYSAVGDVAAFDVMVVRNTGDFLVDSTVYKNPSEELRKALESGFLYAYSPVAIVNSNGEVPRLYSPSEWDEGSSVYHLNDATYPAGSPNSLMTHALSYAEAVHNPGPITAGIMADVGWKHTYIDFEPLKDQEKISPLVFNIHVESDYEINTSSMYVYYSYDEFATHVDSIPLTQGNEPNLFMASLIPAAGVGEVSYFISVEDENTRIFTKPTEAPAEVYIVRFGPDTRPPLIFHNPVPYYFMAEKEIKIAAVVTDNVGIDTVYAEYSINGGPLHSFGLAKDSANLYTGVFNIDNSVLNDRDEISYSIVAVDSSSAKNTTRLPEDGAFSFIVEKLFDPLADYSNDFDQPTSDFILFDFDIAKPSGFETPALHSPHPYPSPERDDSTFNFTTTLKHPIILRAGGTMSFDEVVLVEPGSEGTTFGDNNFWDYVVVEGSSDNGKNWLPLADGYDSRANSIWEENYINSVDDQISNAVGVGEWFVNRRIDLLSNGNFSAGDTILVRFRLFSDPYAHGWGWVIDNLRIQRPVSAPLVLSPGNINIYPNPFSHQFKVSIEPGAAVKNIRLELYNIFGQKIKSFEYVNKTVPFDTNMDLPDAANGIYLLKVSENGKQVLSKKIVKN